MKAIYSKGPLGLTNLPSYTEDQIRTLPMLYRASRSFARSLQNSVVDRFLDAVPETTLFESLDVKVCMLKPGWWPCIPGWHLDDFWRGKNGQPALSELSEHPSIHYMALFGDCSLTEFLTDSAWELPPANLDIPVYGWLNKKIDENMPRTVTAEASKLYSFTQNDFHRGMAATKAGWRAFFRMTQSAHRKPKDEIRRQVQVYVPTNELFKGW